MIVDEGELRERYAAMSNHELADISRSGGLTEVAEKCVKEELVRRGVNGLEKEIEELNEVDRIRESQIQEELKKGRKSIKVTTRPFYVASVVFLVVGLAAFLFLDGNFTNAGAFDARLLKGEKLGLGFMGFGVAMGAMGLFKALTKSAMLKLMVRK